MPELPEVETIARTLAPQVEGRRIVACELLNPSTFEGTIPLGKVVGGIIGRPGRRASCCCCLLLSARSRCLLWTRPVRPVRWPGALPAGMNALPGLGSISK